MISLGKTGHLHGECGVYVCVCVCASMGRRLSGYALYWSMQMCIKWAYSASTTSGLTCIHIFHTLSLFLSVLDLMRILSKRLPVIWMLSADFMNIAAF